jgi:hypothetical protein
MSVAVAVLRNEVQRDGKLVIEDYLYDKDVDGTPVPARFFGIVQQSISNFWHTLAVSCFKRYGTICDRDYEVSREGEGFDTKYSIIPLPEVADLTDIEVVKRFYGYGAPWNAEDPQRFLKCPMTTAEWASYFSGEERYQFWLTPDGGQVHGMTESGSHTTYTSSGNDEFHPATTLNDEAQAMAAAVTPSSSTQFSTLQESLLEAAKKE